MVINREGEAYSPTRAKAIGVEPDVAFMRGDGWILGAPTHLEHIAHEMWSDSWAWFWRKGETEFQPIEMYA